MSLPDGLVAQLDGDRLDTKVGWTALLVTTDGEGFPHVALLSVGELLALRADVVRIALWPTSATTANLTARREALFMAAHEGGALKARLTVRASGSLDGPPLRAWFETIVDSVSVDRVPYARLVSVASFELDSTSDLDRWRGTLEQLATAGRNQQR
jgi:hypothetical protein